MFFYLVDGMLDLIGPVSDLPGKLASLVKVS
jgi:hypothetical protein